MAVSVGDASYEVRYDPGGTNTDITEWVVSIDKCTDVANEINTAVIQFNAEFGAFITESNSGATPILTQWDKIKITFTDKNDNVYSRIFLVKDIFRRRTPNENLRIEVHLVGQEYWLSVIPFPKPFYFENAYTTVRDIVDIYNGTRGTAQASIENHDDKTENELPEFTANTETFGLKEKFCWDGIQEIIDKQGQSLSNLGAGDFFAVHFNDKSGDDDVIELEAFSSGSKPASPVTVQNTLSTPISSIREQLDSETGTVVAVKGAKDAGSLPPELAKFRSLAEAWRLLPQYVSGETYPANTWVQKDGVRYQVNTETSNTPPHADWTARQESDWIGSIDYSPWTNGKANAWKNSGSNPSGVAGGTGTDFDQEGCWDINQIVLDEDNYQNWAHLKSTTDNFDANFKYGVTFAGVYEGLRCFVNGTGTGEFAGHDFKLMQHNGTEWLEIGPIGSSGVRAAVDGDRIAIDNEGLIYKYNGTSLVTDHTGQRANHCYHVYDSIGQSQGVNNTDDGGGSNYGSGSAVKYTYKYTPLSAVGAFPLTTVVNYYSIGAWANLEAPFPVTNHNSQTLGSVYGGDSTTKQPATFDADNLVFTPTGKNGFNETDSNSLYPLTGISFAIKMNWYVTLLSDTDVPFVGDLKYRVFMVDTSDNIVFADFTISHLKHWQSVNIPFSQMKIYRARVPLTLGEDTISNIIVPELEVLDVFNFRDIKKIGIQWQDVYDSEGRFKPEESIAITAPITLGGFLPTSETTVELEIDAFHFTKQVFELSGTDATRPIFSKFLESPHGSNTFQVEQIAKSQVEVEKHQYRAFDVDMDLRCDVGAEHSFFLVDSELIADNDESSGGVKLVARAINYTVNAADGAGGIQTHISPAVKRING